jgi:hypothetical protein
MPGVGAVPSPGDPQTLDLDEATGSLRQSPPRPFRGSRRAGPTIPGYSLSAEVILARPGRSTHL